jgi:hypothetical protein
MNDLWRTTRMAFLLALLTWGLSGCEMDGYDSTSGPDPGSQSTELGLEGAAESASLDNSDPIPAAEEPGKGSCDEVTEAKKKLIPANSNWSFGVMDPTHPDYCDIIEGAYDLLLDFLESEPEMVKEKIVFHIKNEKRFVNGVSIAAYTQPVGSGHTITFYNPQAP